MPSSAREVANMATQISGRSFTLLETEAELGTLCHNIEAGYQFVNIVSIVHCNFKHRKFEDCLYALIPSRNAFWHGSFLNYRVTSPSRSARYWDESPLLGE